MLICSNDNFNIRSHRSVHIHVYLPLFWYVEARGYVDVSLVSYTFKVPSTLHVDANRFESSFRTKLFLYFNRMELNSWRISDDFFSVKILRTAVHVKSNLNYFPGQTVILECSRCERVNHQSVFRQSKMAARVNRKCVHFRTDSLSHLSLSLVHTPIILCTLARVSVIIFSIVFLCLLPLA